MASYRAVLAVAATKMGPSGGETPWLSRLMETGGAFGFTEGLGDMTLGDVTLGGEGGDDVSVSRANARVFGMHLYTWMRALFRGVYSGLCTYTHVCWRVSSVVPENPQLSPCPKELAHTSPSHRKQLLRRSL